MAIPGLQGKFEIRGKVRLGVKKETRSGKSFPASTDYFVSADAELRSLFGERPTELRIVPAYEGSEETFSTGLEWWAKKGDQSYLACYTKGAGTPPVALRLDKLVGSDDETRGEKRGQRQPITCRARECPIFKRKDCRPMARLVFFLEGGRRDRPLQLETKSFNSIERLEPVLQAAAAGGDLRKRVFVLRVAMAGKGDKRYPLLTLEEEQNVISTDGTKTIANPGGDAAVKQAESIIAAEQTPGDNRAKLIAAIEARGADPRDPKVAEWVKRIGIDAALEALTAGDDQ